MSACGSEFSWSSADTFDLNVRNNHLKSAIAVLRDAHKVMFQTMDSSIEILTMLVKYMHSLGTDRKELRCSEKILKGVVIGLKEGLARMRVALVDQTSGVEDLLKSAEKKDRANQLHELLELVKNLLTDGRSKELRVVSSQAIGNENEDKNIKCEHGEEQYNIQSQKHSMKMLKAPVTSAAPDGLAKNPEIITYGEPGSFQIYSNCEKMKSQNQTKNKIENQVSECQQKDINIVDFAIQTPNEDIVDRSLNSSKIKSKTNEFKASTPGSDNKRTTMTNVNNFETFMSPGLTDLCGSPNRISQKRVERLFIGGINKNWTEKDFTNFLRLKNIHYTFINFFSKGIRSNSAQLNIRPSEKAMLQRAGFWPRGVFVKPWISRQELQNRRHSRS